jgi:hypothetical protein
MQPSPIADTSMPDEPSERLGMLLSFAIGLTFTIEDHNRIQFIFMVVKRPAHAALDRQGQICAVRRARYSDGMHGFLLCVCHRYQKYVSCTLFP